MEGEQTRSQSLPSQSFPDSSPPKQRSQFLRPPGYIALPPPPEFTTFALPSPDLSPLYHTAPSSPAVASPALQFYTPPTSPLPVSPPAIAQLAVPPTTDDPFPTSDLPIDIALDDDGLSTLEKTYLFSRSKASFHRVFITHALPDYLDYVAPQEATEYVLPLLSGLAMDEEEQVKEALAAELVPLIWWFFTHCQIIPDDFRTDETIYPSESTPTTISVQAFTPILGTLLLSSNPLVGGATRYAIVDLLSRLKKADDNEAPLSNAPPAQIEQDEDQDSADWFIGLFLRDEREMFRNEILQQVVIGMGRLDVDMDDSPADDPSPGPWLQANIDSGIEVVTAGEQGNGEEGVSSPREMQRARSESGKLKDNDSVNPYFPAIATSHFSIPSPTSSAGSTPSSASTTDSGSLSPSPSHSTGNASPSSIKGHVSPTPLFASSTSAANRTLDSPSPEDTEITPPGSQVIFASSASQLSTSSQGTPPTNNGRVLSPTTAAPAQKPSLPISPTEERWSAQDQPSHSPQDHRTTNPADVGLHTAYDIRADYSDEYGSEEGEQNEQAAVGRLSSMSLMAAVAASGTLGEEMKEAFVNEITRVGQDPVYWVRREASFALGALAKVVPEEIVICSFLPLFDSLRHDAVWHVRHSALFALPAILSRLPPHQRRSLAVDTITTLSTDESPAVRLGVLEALGEVLYTFFQDEGGPPEKLVQLFLGRKEDKRVRDGQQVYAAPQVLPTRQAETIETPLELFYTDPERPLICGFNYPAVALTLGKERWSELREVYLDIAANRAIKVRRTIAASLGELAKIIGGANAHRDLLSVWWDAIRCEEEEVRARAIDCAEAFISALGIKAGDRILAGLIAVWDEGVFSGWREREGIAKTLVGLLDITSVVGHGHVVGLLRRALEDNAAAVREAAISALPVMWRSLSDVGPLRIDVDSLAKSTIYRRRMTFVACQQALITPRSDGQPIVPLDDRFWFQISHLANDNIIGVRIAIARLIGFISETALAPISGVLLSLIQRLSQDLSHEVQSYVPDPLLPPTGQTINPRKKQNPDLFTFSRPPPPRAPNGTTDNPTHASRIYNGNNGGHSDLDNAMDIASSSFGTDHAIFSERHPSQNTLMTFPQSSLANAGSASFTPPDADVNANTSLLVPA